MTYNHFNRNIGRRTRKFSGLPDGVKEEEDVMESEDTAALAESQRYNIALYSLRLRAGEGRYPRAGAER